MKKTDKEIDIVRESEREQNEKKEIDGQTDRRSRDITDGYLYHWIFAWTIDDIVQGPFTTPIINANKLQQRCINEAHTDAIPYIHCR